MKLKLSDAIREGAKKKPQGFIFYREDGTSCALGAAADARGYKGRLDTNVFLRWWPILGEPSTCPSLTVQGCEHHRSSNLLQIVLHLNDDHKWTREAIADFIETTAEVRA